MRWAIVCCALELISGCTALRRTTLTSIRLSIETAGYAGRFRLAYQRWPHDQNEMEEFMCMRGRADRFDLQQPRCEEVIHYPYRLTLVPKGRDLEIDYDDRKGMRLCSLTLRAPSADAEGTPFPTIVIEANMFSCPGNDEMAKGFDR